MRISIRAGTRGRISTLVPELTLKLALAQVLIFTLHPTRLSFQVVKVSTEMRTSPGASRTATDMVIPTSMVVRVALSHPAAAMINMVPGGARTNMATNSSFFQYGLGKDVVSYDSPLCSRI